ncbi:Antigen KI-67 [Heterocephalus glaber]|uniref:Antigen KI-67 n=1 Tax=Heterocephalus glaber TaxID=10181 RepID=G5BTI0_HETGA|nr:Antigen KI-67 [Heterocephalus glaber]
MGPTARLVTIKRSGVDGIPFPLSLSTCLFGRGTECDIRIQLPVVSKQHCKIEINKQEAILYNFSSTNPTQVNGSAIDEPVPLRHGDIITIIDRSFRYENESHQKRSKSPEFPAKLGEQKSTRRSSRASFSADFDGKDQDSKAHSNITEGNASGRSGVHVKELKRNSLTSDGSKDSAGQEPLKAPSSECPRHSNRNARNPTTEDFKEKSRVTIVGCYGELNSFPTTQFLDNGKKNESPFKNLYQSIKEEFGVKSQRQNVVQYRRKSESPTAYTAEKDGANCSQKETQLLMSCKSRPKSNRSTHINGASSPVPEMSQAEENKNDAELIQTSKEVLSSSISLFEVTVKTPVQHSQQQRSSRKRKSEDLHVTDREESVNLVERKFQKDSLDKPEKLGITPGQIGSGLLGLSSVDISNFGGSINKNEDVSLKRRRVSFGGHLRPELFDENLPPNTPLKRGETPAKRRSLGTHTPAVLKKIIKEQPQSSGKEESSEVKAHNVCIDAQAPNPRITSTRTNDQKGRSVKASTASNNGKSPHETDMPKKAGRKSGHLASKRGSISRSQHDILQMISSKRRSGASEANLIVAKSWADVVKLGAKQTQTKVVKHGPQRQMNKRQRRPNTPKKPSVSVHNQFSTGHANSPCTIIIGKAQIEKVNVPAQPYRILNSFVFNKKMDYNEDLSGLTEMFKTPVKEKPQMSTCSVTFSNSDNFLGKKSKVISSGEESLSIPSVNLGENVYSSAQNAAEEPSDKCFESPMLRRKCIKGDETIVKTPKNFHKLTHFKMKTPDSMTEPLTTVSNTNKLRRSMELRKMQMLPVESKNENKEADITENFIGKSLRKTPLREKEKEREMKDSERSLETCKENVESNENSGKVTTVRRSRSGGKKYEPTDDLTALKRTPEREPTEYVSGTQMLLQKTDCAKESTNEAGTTTKMPRKSSQPEPIHSSTSRKRQLKTPQRKVDVKEEVPALRKHSKISEEYTHIVGDDKSMEVFKETPKQKLDPGVYATEMKRWSRTPKKSQPLEDLAGIKELIQTPEHLDEPVHEYKPKVPCGSPHTKAMDTPRKKNTLLNTLLRKVDIKEGKAMHTPKATEGDDKGIKAFKESAKQTLDPAANTSSSKRWPRTPKAKAQTLEDLTGFQELFQTPGHTKDSITEREDQSRPVDTSTTSKRRSKTSLGKIDGKEELSIPRKLTQSPGRAMHTPSVPIQKGKNIRESMQTPKQKLDLTENLTELKRPARTPKTKAQPLEDLAGFQELFQTPGHSKNSSTTEETPRTLFRSPQPMPLCTATTSKRHSKISLGKVDMKEQLSSQKKVTQLPGKATHTPLVPVQEKGIRTSTETPKQKLDQRESLAGFDRCLQTPETKAQPLEDLIGFQELFQTSGHGKDPMTSEKTTKMLCRSPQSAPVDTPTSKRCRKTSLGKVDVKQELSLVRGLTQMSEQTVYTLKVKVGGGDKSICCDASAEQTLDPSTNVSGSRRQRRRTKTETQLLEDLTGFQELFQTPGDAKDPMIVEITKMPCVSPQPGPLRTPPTLNRRPRTSLGIVDMKEVLSAPRKPTQSPAKSLHTHTVPVQEEKGIKASAETPKQKLDPTESLHGLKRQPQTPKEKTEALEDLTGFQELFQTPDHAKDPITPDETTEMSSRFIQPGSLNTPATSKRRPKISLEKADRKEMSALRKLMQTTGEAISTSKVLEGDDKVFKDFVEQKLIPVPTSNKRQPKKRKEKVPPLEDLVGFQELFQTPGHAKDRIITDETTKMPCVSLQTESVNTPTRVVRWSTTSLGEKNVKEHLAVNSLTQIPGKIAYTHEDPTDDKGNEVFNKSTKQKPNSGESVTGSKRLRGESKKNSQPLEDLTGFKELFQTPGHTEESDHCTLQLKEIFQTPDHAKNPMKTEESTKMPCTSLQAGPLYTPTSKRCSKRSLGKIDGKEELSSLRRQMESPGRAMYTPSVPAQEQEGIRASTETPKQKLELTENLTALRRQSQTRKAEAQFLEDLSGFQELFQTPDHAKNPMKTEESTKMPCTSLQAGPLYTPTSKRCSKRSLGKIDGKEELSSLRRQMESPGRAMYTPSVPAQEQEGIRISTETPKQNLDLIENLTTLRRESRTPKAKAQPLEDLSGFQELFQTPSHTKDPAIADKTPQTLCSSQSTPVDTRTTSKRCPKTSIGKMDVKELSFVRKKTLRETVHTHKEAIDDKDNEVFKESAKRKLDRAENGPGTKRLQRAPKEKDQALEDLGGFQEFFQMPGHSEESVSDEKATITPYISPQSEPVRTQANTKRGPRTRVRKVNVKEDSSAMQKPTRMSRATIHTSKVPECGDKGIEPLKKLEKKTLDLAAGVSGNRRWPRAAKAKAQPLQDQAGSRELSQTLSHTEELVRDEKTTKMPCRSSQQEPGDTLTTSRRGPRTRFGKVDMTEELSTQRKQTGTTGETVNTHKEPTDDSKSIKEFKESTKRKLEPEEDVTATKRLRGTHKEKTQLLEDLAGLKELIPKPAYTEESLRGKKTTKMPCKSSQPEPVDAPTSTKRQLRARLGNVNVKEGLLVVRKPTRTSRAITHTSKVPEGEDKDIKAFKESSEQALDPTTSVTSNRRYPRASKAKSQVEDLPSPKEISQIPDHTEEQINDVHNLKSSLQQTPDSIKPLKTFRRVLRVPKEKSIDLVDTKDPAASQSKSNISLAPKWKSGQDRNISRTRGCVTTPRDTIGENLVHNKQRTTPRERYKSRDPLNIMKKRVRVVMNRIESVEEQNNNMKSIKKEHTVQDSSTPNKGMSLRSRHQNKTDVNQQKLEIPISEKAKLKRHEKKSMKTSEESEQQIPGDGAGKPTSKGKVGGNRICLRPGRQNKSSQPHTAEEDVKEKNMEIFVKNGKENEVTNNSDTDKDIKDTKKIRTRSHRNIEDI